MNPKKHKLLRELGVSDELVTLHEEKGFRLFFDRKAGAWLMLDPEHESEYDHPFDEIFEMPAFYKEDPKPGTRILKTDFDRIFQDIDGSVLIQVVERYTKLTGSAGLDSQVPAMSEYARALREHIARYKPRFQKPRENARSVLSAWLCLAAETIAGTSSATERQREEWFSDEAIRQYRSRRGDYLSDWQRANRPTEGFSVWVRRRNQRAWVVRSLLAEGVFDPLAILYFEAGILWYRVSLGHTAERLESDVDGLCEAFQSSPIIAQSMGAGLRYYGEQINILMDEAINLDIKHAAYDLIIHDVLHDRHQPKEETFIQALADTEEETKSPLENLARDKEEEVGSPHEAQYDTKRRTIMLDEIYKQCPNLSIKEAGSLLREIAVKDCLKAVQKYIGYKPGKGRGDKGRLKTMLKEKVPEAERHVKTVTPGQVDKDRDRVKQYIERKTDSGETQEKN